MKLEKSDLQLETVVSRIRAKELDLQPDFQRGEIWDLKRRQRLIDTILRNWYVPAVHIVVGADGHEVVLDGQQRLAAIRDFVDDDFKVDGSTEPYNSEIAAMDGKRFSQLAPDVRRAINRFVLHVVTLTEFDPQEPNELFFRLNQSYNLTPPEKRNALHGVARDQVKELVSTLAAEGLLDRGMIGFSNGRLAYDDIVSRVCVAIQFGSLRTHINNSVVEKFYRESGFSDKTLGEVLGSGRLLRDLIQSTGGRVKFNKGTLQTWLVYCYWAPKVTGELPVGLLTGFETDRGAVRNGETNLGQSSDRSIDEVLRIYDDRASYRVTDVSSVIARDLAVHLYSASRFGTARYRGSAGLLERLTSSEPQQVQGIFFEYLDASRWGDPIVPESER